MSSPIIVVDSIGKRYTLGTTIRHDTLRDKLAYGLKRTFRRRPETQVAPAESTESDQDFWALRDVSFQVQPGESVGIIGRNGAGKSTLLKILSRITEPTEGEVRMRGRVASLLEVGTGFHPELTGRENIFLNGAILGMTKREISRRFEEIVAFAEVERFLDTPVKRYSSGMHVRLAFAVAAHLDPEILIVDEVLAVGDLAFQQKCIGRMNAVAKEGRTILFVSHNMEAVRRLCTRGVLLEDGRVTAAGSTDDVLNRYIQTDSAPTTLFQIKGSSERADKAASATALAVESQDGMQTNGFSIGQAWQIKVFIEVTRPLEHFVVAVGLLSQRSIAVWTVWTAPARIEPGCYEAVFLNDKVSLAAGTYGIAVGLSNGQTTLHYVEEAGRLVISPISTGLSAKIITGEAGFIINQMHTRIERAGPSPQSAA